jgi:small subunit ribosomal protein S6
MREYELYLVIDADSEEDAVTEIVERVTQLIAVGDGQTSGEVIKVTPRGRRRLAYPINKKPEGRDVIVNFQGSPHSLPEIERFLKLNEDVLRYLIIRTDEH